MSYVEIKEVEGKRFCHWLFTPSKKGPIFDPSKKGRIFDIGAERKSGREARRIDYLISSLRHLCRLWLNNERRVIEIFLEKARLFVLRFV